MVGRRASALYKRNFAILLLIGAILAPIALSAQLPRVRGFRDCVPAPAAGARTISVGTCVRSTLGSGDETIDGYIHYEDYRLTLQARESVRIDMDSLPGAGGSDTFDTYLEILRPGEEMSLRFNDDRPESLNSTLIFRAEVAGTYLVRARSLGSGTGDYALRVIPAPATQLRELALHARPIRSTLAENDTLSGERYYEEFQLRLAAGQVVQIDMDAVEGRTVGNAFLDPYLAILDPESDQVLATNDDRGGSLNARLFFRAPAAGAYRLRAQGFRLSTGEYLLSARRVPAMPRPNVLANDQAEGPWEDGSPATERDGQPIRYQEYTFQGQEGERIQIDATSTLPPRLMFGPIESEWLDERMAPGPGRRPRPGLRPAQLADGQTVRIVHVLPRTGAYVVRLEVPGSQNGFYRLRLGRATGARSASPRELVRGEPLDDRLGLDAGVILRSGSSGPIASLYRLYALPMQAGESVVVTLESQDFDPVLDAGVMSGLDYAVALSNDDSNGWSSRLELRPTTNGTIYLRARSFRGDVGEGRYTLRAVAGSAASPAPAPPPTR